MCRLRLASIGLLAALLLEACVGVGATPGASAVSGETPRPTLDHATGPTDVILRMATGGGLMAPGALLTEIPEFSLYGDGTVVFRDPARSYVEPYRPDGIGLRLPFQTARLSEAQVQAVLEDAIGRGGLGAARESYPPIGIADAPSTTFTIRAGGLDKQVTVGALGFEQTQPSPDDSARKAFQVLAQRLVAPDLGEAIAVAYSPGRFRGILTEAGDMAPVVRPRPWPWTTFGPADFAPSADAAGLPTPTRTLTTGDVAALRLEGVEGGAVSIALEATGGAVYLLALRPLLPDERS
jgi:hypothetical protein